MRIRRTRTASSTIIALTAVTLIAAAPAAGQFGGFGPPDYFSAGNTTRDVALGDFDGDGDIDVAVTVSVENSIAEAAIFLNDGNGSFSANGTVTVGPPSTTPQMIESADLNQDGDVDLVTANRGSFTGGDSVSVLLGDGAGNFTLDGEYDGIWMAPRSLDIGDVDNDGDLDLVVPGTGYSDNAGNTVTLMLNDGNAAFTDAGEFDVGEQPWDAALADFDSDGWLDVAVSNYGLNGSGQTVSILLNDATGVFAPAENVSVRAGPRHLDVADFNNDGAPDIVVPTSDSVSVLLNPGDGTFESEDVYMVGDRPNAVSVADFDGDGDTDIAVEGDANEDETIEVLLNQGDGSFVLSAASTVVPERVDLFETADLDNTSSPDVAVMSVDGFSVLLNQTAVAPPGPIELQAPKDGVVALSPLTPMLAWTQATGFGVTYNLTVADDSAFTDIVLDETGLSETTFEVPDGALEDGTEYFWQVTATNPQGDTPASNGPYSFATLIPGDFDLNGVIDVFDLLELLSNWGGPQ